jgi:hypothetical protein
MDWWAWLLIAVVVAAVAMLLWAASKARRSKLRDAFGPEYDRAVDGADSRRQGEGALRDRLRRHRELELQPLDPEVAAQYAAEWMGVQIKFVDVPDEACAEAEHLVDRVLRARGYPVGDFDTQADLVSVDHPELVDEYRRAHATLHGRNGGTQLEDLRVAFVAYRGLFSDLVAEQRPSPAAERDDVEERDEVEPDVTVPGNDAPVEDPHLSEVAERDGGERQAGEREVGERKNVA